MSRRRCCFAYLPWSARPNILDRLPKRPFVHVDAAQYMLEQCVILSSLLANDRGCVMMCSLGVSITNMHLRAPSRNLPLGVKRHWMRIQLLAPAMQAFKLDVAPPTFRPTHAMAAEMRQCEFDETWRTHADLVYRSTLLGTTDDESWMCFMMGAYAESWQLSGVFIRARGTHATLAVNDVVDSYVSTLDHHSVRLLPPMEVGFAAVAIHSAAGAAVFHTHPRLKRVMELGVSGAFPVLVPLAGTVCRPACGFGNAVNVHLARTTSMWFVCDGRLCSLGAHTPRWSRAQGQRQHLTSL